MDFGAEIADRSYQEIPTGALRPRNDMSDGAFNRPINSNYVHHPVDNYQQKDTEKKKLRIYFCNLLCYYVFGEDWDFCI